VAHSFGSSHCEIDITWDLDPAEIDLVLIDLEDKSPASDTRAMMPTLHEEDPLRYDLAYRREHAARDSMPTLPDIDPLSYDVPD